MDITFRKTRIAPTPSGYLHLGNILSFAITASLAQRAGARILLRIDDADRERTNKIYVQDIFDTLSFLEIPWHDGPRNMEEYEQQYSQVRRVDLYNKALQRLQESGRVFACTCSRADLARAHPESVYTGTCSNKHLPLDTPNAGWRLQTSADKLLHVKTPGGVVAAALPPSMHQFMVKKRDGFAAYQLTSLVDDIYFDIDMIVRGADLWPSTLAQLYLASVLDETTFGETVFYHHRLIMDADGNKLSKSAGATSVHYLRQAGKTPADIFGMTAHMMNVDMHPASWTELIAMLDIDLLAQ